MRLQPHLGLWRPWAHGDVRLPRLSIASPTRTGEGVGAKARRALEQPLERGLLGRQGDGEAEMPPESIAGQQEVGTEGCWGAGAEPSLAPPCRTAGVGESRVQPRPPRAPPRPAKEGGDKTNTPALPECRARLQGLCRPLRPCGRLLLPARWGQGLRRTQRPPGRTESWTPARVCAGAALRAASGTPGDTLASPSQQRPRSLGRGLQCLSLGLCGTWGGVGPQGSGEGGSEGPGVRGG